MVPPCFAGVSQRTAFLGPTRPWLCNGSTRLDLLASGGVQSCGSGMSFGGSECCVAAPTALWNPGGLLLVSVIAVPCLIMCACALAMRPL
jgi:hypothetical protein